MAVNKKVNYKSGLEILIKNNFPSEKLDISGLKRMSELLNDVNSLLIYHMETEYSSVGKVNGQTLQHCARKAIDENFPGNLKENALSEAYKQLALLESGCIVYGKGATAVKGKTENREDVELQRIDVPIRLFKKGIEKLISATFPNFQVDSKAIGPLALCIHAFSKMVARRASDKASQKEELQLIHLKDVLPEYFGNNALKVALGEANRCLVLYEKGLIEFEPKAIYESGRSQENEVSEKILPTVFKPGIKNLLSEIVPGYEIEARATGYLGHILMDVARYIAENASETCRKEKLLEIKDGDIHQSVSATFPLELKEHAQLNCAKDVIAFQSGMISYERTPLRRTESESNGIKRKKKVQRSTSVKPKKQAKVKKSSPKPRQKSPVTVSKKTPKSSPVPKKKKSSKSPKRLPSSKKRRSKSPPKYKKPKSSPVPKKKKSSKSPKRLPTSKKRRSKSPPKDKKPSMKIAEKMNFALSIMPNVMVAFSSIDISLTKESESNLNEILEDICNALINFSVSRATNTEEMGIKDIQGAIREFFPPELAEHALLTAFDSLYMFLHETHSYS